MLSSFLLALREGLEVALILGILLGALRKIRREELRAVVWSGAASAAALSTITAVALTGLGASLEGEAEAIFEGLTMLLAAGVLTWMIFWMRRQARGLKGALEADVRRATLRNGKRALFVLALVTILREGVELALFLTAAVFTTSAGQTLTGAAFGLALAFLLGWLLFASIIKLDLRRFFLVTGILLVLFAAGLIAHGVHELNEVGWIPAVVEHVWDVNFVLDEASIPGQLLKALFGYNGNPSLSEVLAYTGYFAAILLYLRRSAVPLPAPGRA